MSDQKTWEALMDDTDIAMSIDGENASFHTKRLASALHFKDRECKDLRARAEAAETGSFRVDAGIKRFLERWDYQTKGKDRHDFITIDVLEDVVITLRTQHRSEVKP